MDVRATEFRSYDEVKSAIYSAHHKYMAARSIGGGVAAARDGLKNVMFNGCDQIMSLFDDYSNMCKMYKKLAEEKEVAESALADSDNEIRELEKKLKGKSKE